MKLSTSIPHRRAACVRLVSAVTVMLVMTGCAANVRRRIYLPEPMPATTSWSADAPQDVSVTTADGVMLRGYYWPPKSSNQDVIVFFHGQSGNRYKAAQIAAPLAAEGGVLVASYRGYGDNAGTPTEEGLFEDGAAFVSLARRLAPASRIYLFGYSLGAAVALQTAVREDVAGVITLGAFTSLADAAPSYARGLLPDRFDNRRAIAQVTEPILILHGTADEIVPFAQARALRDAAPGKARLLTIEGGSHLVDFVYLAPIVWKNLREMPR
jgi:fermentation-respiration switch protein FrsA (DUF1100 family)